MAHSTMSYKTQNKLRRPLRCKCVNKVKHSRKSVEWHKRRILARLNPKIDKGLTIEISQYVMNKQSLLYIRIADKHKWESSFPLKHYPVNEHHRIVKALRYLVDENKIKSNVTTKEWDVQIALGVAESRTFTRKEK